MLLQLLGSGSDIKTVLGIILLTIPMILIALCLHEVSHGYAAYLCGDSTAKAHGRLSLNPLHHLDPIGTLCMLLVGYGWAKPVPIITRNFKKPRRDMFIVAFAGPLSNLLLAFVLTPLSILAEKGYASLALQGSQYALPMYMLATMLFFGVSVNIGLALFNLIPLPPLDGSNMLLTALPHKMAAKYAQIGRYGSQILFVAILLSRYTPIDIFWPISFLQGWIMTGYSFVFSFLM